MNLQTLLWTEMSLNTLELTAPKNLSERDVMPYWPKGINMTAFVRKCPRLGWIPLHRIEQNFIE